MGHEEDLEKARMYARRVKQKQEIDEIKHSNDKIKKSLSFSKMAVVFIFVNCLIIEIYSMVVMFLFHDLTSLGSLIASVVGQCITLISYTVKAGRENTIGGLTYEATMLELKEQVESSSEEDDGAVG